MADLLDQLMQADQSQYPEVSRDQYSEFLSHPLWKRIKVALQEQRTAAINGLRECSVEAISLHRATLNVIDSILGIPAVVLEEINEEETDV